MKFLIGVTVLGCLCWACASGAWYRRHRTPFATTHQAATEDYFDSKGRCWLVEESSGVDVYYGEWKKISGKNRFQVVWDEDGKCELEFTLEEDEIQLKRITEGCDSADRYVGRVDRKKGYMEGYAYFKKRDGSELRGRWKAEVLQ